jgi:PAS domain S-box-containing protein
MTFVASDSNAVRAQMDAVLQAVSATVWVLDTELRFQGSSGVVPRRRGLSHEQLIGLHLDDYLGSEPAPEREAIASALAGAQTTFSTVRPDGRELENVVGPLQAEDDEITGVVGVTIDVTERNRRSHERDQRLRLMLDQVPGFLWTTDLDLRVTELVGDAAGLRGLTPVGETLTSFWGTSDPVGAVAAHARAAEGESVENEATIFDRTLVSHLEPLRNAVGEIVGVVGVAIDVTAERRLQQALARAQQLEALGRFAGGVAHDINNMLFGVSGFIDLALAREIDDDAKRHLENASGTLAHSAEMTRQLLAFSRGQHVELQPLSLSEAVNDAAPLLEQLTGHECLIDLRLADELPPIMADSTQLEQALTNLVVNARDAGGSTVVVGTRLRVLDAPLATDGGDLCPGPWIELAVSDDGRGMDAETRERLFEPFFTTKDDGTGLGLATVFAMVRRSGGGIVVESSPDGGTTLRVLFPPAGLAV